MRGTRNEVQRYDENGWYRGLGEPLAPELAYTIYSPEPSGRLDLGDLDRELARIAEASARLVVPKRYPQGMTPTLDAAELELSGGGLEPTILAWWSFPIGRAPGLLGAAHRAAELMGGGGMDALLPRTKRVQQVAVAPLGGDDPRAPLLLAAAISQRCLGPVLPPGQERLLGPSSLRSLVARALGPE